MSETRAVYGSPAEVVTDMVTEMRNQLASANEDARHLANAVELLVGASESYLCTCQRCSTAREYGKAKLLAHQRRIEGLK